MASGSNSKSKQVSIIISYLRDCVNDEYNSMPKRAKRGLQAFLDGGSSMAALSGQTLADESILSYHKKGKEKGFYFPPETSFLRQLTCRRCLRFPLGAIGSARICSGNPLHIICSNCFLSLDEDTLHCYVCKKRVEKAESDTLLLFNQLSRHFKIPCDYQIQVSFNLLFFNFLSFYIQINIYLNIIKCLFLYL